MISSLCTTIAAAWLLAAGPADQPADEAAAEARHLKNIRQVTLGSDFVKAGEGYFRPDGRGIIFQAVPPGKEDYQIYTQGLAPGSPAKMVSTGKGKCTCSAYHPDGTSILFASSHLDPALAAGAKPAAEPKGPAYSRTGQSYRWDFDPHMDIFKADTDGKNLVRLTDTPGYDAEGSYSPDAKHIIFTSFRDGNAEIYIMDADGTDPRRVTNAKGYDGGPFFSPDGRKIIYRSDRKENDLLQVYINTPGGDAERALTSNESVNWGPYFLPDSRHIVYAKNLNGDHRNYEVFLMDTDTGREDRVTHYTGFDGLPVISPDGSKMLWTAKGRTPDNTSQLFIADFILDPATASSR